MDNEITIVANGTSGEVVLDNPGLSNDLNLEIGMEPINNVDIESSGDGDYNNLVNQPKINGVTVRGSKNGADYQLASLAQGQKADTALQPGDNISTLVNDSGYQTSAQVADSISTHNTSADAHSSLFAGKQDTISDLSTIRSGAEAGATAVQPGDLATVATTGDYDDLLDKPTIPTVNNATLTIQKNGTDVQTFTANASTDVTANITVPTNVSDLNNDTGFITSSALSGYVQSSDLATVATTGAYSDLSGTPTIPTVNDATITITQGGVTKGSFTLNQSSADTIALDAGGSGGKSIGEVYFSESSSAADNPGGLPLFTGETIANADQVYPDFYDWVADHADLQITAANYETAISTYGECPKYVIDTVNKTIRLPKLVNYLKMANTTDKITQAVAGLPNITGSITNSGEVAAFQKVSGSFTGTSGSYHPISTGSGTYTLYKTINLDASQSSSVYGNSNTVTPSHTTLYPWVCAFNAAVEASVAQAAEFQEALSGKADTNLSNTANTTSKSIDGQWVASWLSIIGSQTTITAESYNDYDLSSYLPNDAYNYEVLGYITCVTGSSSGNMADVYVISPGLITSGLRVCRAITRTSNTNTSTGSFNLPIGSQRTIRMGNYSQQDCLVSFFRLVAYRRIGTNS